MELRSHLIVTNWTRRCQAAHGRVERKLNGVESGEAEWRAALGVRGGDEGAGATGGCDEWRGLTELFDGGLERCTERSSCDADRRARGWVGGTGRSLECGGAG
jgi:hypothetical protein